MRKQDIIDYGNMLQPDRERYGFLEDLKMPMEYSLPKGHGCDAGELCNALEKGVCLRNEALAPRTALASLRRLFKEREIEERAGGYLISFQQENAFQKEEYAIKTGKHGADVTAGEVEGFRRATYHLAELIAQAEGKSIMPGSWRRRPFVRHRISRCFFGPTNRAPYFIDELMNDVDYYPENYLDKLAREGVNGLWLTMYFRDLPSSIFPGRGADAEKRLEKLRRTVARCAEYGIRIYVFTSEPKYFGSDSFAVNVKDAEGVSGVVAQKLDAWHRFCVGSQNGRAYLRECVETLFAAVPGLGGLINIMYGEDNGSCIGGAYRPGACPVCHCRSQAEGYAELANLFADAMHKYNSDAEFIGWFYAPGQEDGTASMESLLDIAKAWPDNCTMMLNFESGGHVMQLGKERLVSDYSLAFVGPSQLFCQASTCAPRLGAKLQVGCSHEDASVPFIPVPENLFLKYSFMAEHGIAAAMQCWYFGNYPGLMNNAAGKLSFLPFPDNAASFLVELARPFWGCDAELVAQAWTLFSRAYRGFPGNIMFEWYGPLHNSIAWPLHLFPVDEPISPTWILECFPRCSGDRIGECIGYNHTLPEILTLCDEMSELWSQGVRLMESLAPAYENVPDRMADIRLAQAIALQMASTCNVLHFYQLRETMLQQHRDHLPEMARLVQAEIDNSRQMAEICRQDSRIGYHSEAEGYLFFPEKLERRIQLLNALLAEDFSSFDLNAPWIDEYTGRTPGGKVAFCSRDDKTIVRYDLQNGKSWHALLKGEIIRFRISEALGGRFRIYIEPCRMWMPFVIMIDEKGNATTLPEATTAKRHYGEKAAVSSQVQGNDIIVDVPLLIFRGLHEEGLPFRINITGDGFHWIEQHPWPCRLVHAEYNPNDMGWLVLT